MKSFDSYGWLSLADIPGRQASVDAPNCGTAPVVGQDWPNWTGVEWTIVNYIEPVILAPAPIPLTWPAFDFYRRFTSTERKEIRLLAKTDPNAEDFIHTLDAAIASGTPIHTDDVDVIDGLAYLVSKGVIASNRPAELLAV